MLTGTVTPFAFRFSVVASGVSLVAYGFSGQPWRSAAKQAIDLGVNRAIQSKGPLGELLKDKAISESQASLGENRCQ